MPAHSLFFEKVVPVLASLYTGYLMLQAMPNLDVAAFTPTKMSASSAAARRWGQGRRPRQAH